MQTITLEILNPEDAEVILLLAKRLRCKILETIQEPKKTANSHKALMHLRNIAKNGGFKNTIPNPLEWQKEIRKDRPLLDRV
jgi:hypothetical protein